MPEPPNDLVLARKEYRKCVNNFGQLKMSLKKELVHYHIKQECLKSKDSAFDPHNIIVTGHIRSDLQDIHKDMIRQNMQLRLWTYITVNKYAVEFLFVIITCQFTKLSYTDFNFLIFDTLLLSFCLSHSDFHAVIKYWHFSNSNK